MSMQVNSMLERAEELLSELEEEFNKCLRSQYVTEKSQNLTHEVLEKLRSTIDHLMAMI